MVEEGCSWGTLSEEEIEIDLIPDGGKETGEVTREEGGRTETGCRREIHGGTIVMDNYTYMYFFLPSFLIIIIIIIIELPDSYYI